MDKQLFDRYKKNKKDLTRIERELERLRECLDEVPIVSGKVTKSSDDFPYIEEHVTVKMAEPKEAQELKSRIRSKEECGAAVKKEIDQVEAFIKKLPEGVEKQVFEMVYLDGMTQREVASALGYSFGRISQMLSKTIKD